MKNVYQTESYASKKVAFLNRKRSANLLLKAALIVILTLGGLNSMYAQLSGGWDSYQYKADPGVTNVGFKDHGNGVIQLTNTAQINCAGAAVLETTEPYDYSNSNFSKCYKVFFACPGNDNIGSDSKGDGLAFSFWKSTTPFNMSTSGNSCAGGIGYGGAVNDNKMITIEFDTYNNQNQFDFDPVYGSGTTGFNDEIAIHKDGNPQTAGRITSFDAGNMEDGKEHEICISYNRTTGTLSATIDGLPKMSYAMGADNFANYFGAGATLNQAWSTGKYGATGNFTVSKGASISDNTNGLIGLPNPQMADQTICAGASTTFDAGSYASYVWSGQGTGTAQTTPAPSTKPGNYIVNVTNAAGCSAIDTAVLKVDPIPAPTTQTDSICSGVAFSITPSKGTIPLGTTYTWSAPTGAGFNGGAAQGTAQTAITGTLTNTTNGVVTATYSVTPKLGNCPGTPFDIVVKVKPKPVIANMTDTRCSGTAFSVTPANGGGNTLPAGTTYTWTTPTGTPTGGTLQATGVPAPISQTLTNALSTAANSVYTVTPTSGTCAGVPFTVTVTVNPVPSINTINQTRCTGIAFSVDPLNGTNGVVPGGTQYTWALPTGTPGGGSAQATFVNAPISQILTNTTNAPAVKTYIVTPRAGATCVGDTFLVKITVNGIPSITTQPADTLKSCAGGSITTSVVASASTAPLSYQWYKGGVIINGQTGASLTLSNLAAGDEATYTVRVSDAAACSTIVSKGTVVKVGGNATPKVTMTISRNQLCSRGQAADTIRIVATGSDGGPGPRYTFRVNNIAVASNQVSNVFTYPIPPNNGTTVQRFGVSVEMLSNSGCLSPTAPNPAVSAVDSFKVDPLVTVAQANITTSDDTICTAGRNIALQTILPTGYTAAWTTTNGASVSATGVVTGIPKNTTTKTKYTVQSPLKLCPSRSDSVLTFRSPDITDPDPVRSNNQKICSTTAAPDLTEITPLKAGETGVWSVATGTTAAINATTGLTSNLKTGNNQFIYTISNANSGCPADTALVTIVVEKEVDAAVAGTDMTTCASSYQLAATPVTNGKGTWTASPAAGISFAPNANDPAATASTMASGQAYTFTWTVSNPAVAVCPSKSDDVIITQAGSITSATPVATQSKTICEGILAPSLDTTGVGILKAAESGTWAAAPGQAATITAAGKTGNLQVGNNVFTYTIMTTVPGCTPSKGTVTIKVDPLPGPALAITGPATVCAGATGNIYSIATVANAAKYIWTVPTGATFAAGDSTATSITVAFGTTGGQVSVTPKNGCGSGTSSSKTITVNPNLTPAVTINGPDSICVNDFATFYVNTAQDSGSAPAYKWFVNTTQQASTGISFTSNTLVNGDKISVEMTSNETCLTTPKATSPAKILKVVPSVAPSVTITPLVVCAGTAQTITAYPVAGGTTPVYQWKVNTALQAETGSTLSRTFTNGDIIDVKMTSSSNCAIPNSATVSKTLQVNPVPVATATDNSTCSGVSKPIVLSSNAKGTIFKWVASPATGITGVTAGQTGVSTPTDSSITYTLFSTLKAPADVDYSVTPELTISGTKCVGVPIPVKTTVNPIPVVSATVAAICSGETTSIPLTSDITSGVTTFTWTATGNGAFADSNDSIVQILTNNTTASVPSDYKITPTANGCKGAVLSKSFLVKPIPTLTPLTPAAICPGDTSKIVLTNNVTTTGVTSSYTWTSASSAGVTGAKTFDTVNPIIAKLDNSGAVNGTVTYDITPTVDGCTAPNPAQVVVTIKPKPIITLKGAAPICSGAKTAIVVASSVAGTTYTWTMTPSAATIVGKLLQTPAAAMDSITEVVTNNGNVMGKATYSVTPFAATCKGDVKDITVDINPAPNAIAQDKIVCDSAAFSIGISSTSGTNPTYKWTSTSTGNLVASSYVQSDTVKTITGTPVNNGTADAVITYTITPSGSGCPGVPATVKVTVHPSPRVQAVVADTNLCSGERTAINVNSQTVGTTFNVFANAPGFDISNMLPGVIDQKLDVTAETRVIYRIKPSANGCPGVDTTVSLVVHAIPLAVAGMDTSYCEDLRAILGGPNNPAYLYSWLPATSLSSDTISNPVTTAIKTTGYTLTVRLKANTDCKNSDVVTVNVSPKYQVDAGEYPAICIGDVVTITATPNLDRYEWSTGVVGTNSIEVSPMDTMKYIVKTKRGECYSTDSTFIYTKNQLNPDVYVPSSFSPNGDEVNDHFKAYGENIVEFDGNVFTRWGELVYHWEDVKGGWDGKLYSDSEIAKNDTYVYTIRVKYVCDKVFSPVKKGVVTAIK